MNHLYIPLFPLSIFLLPHEKATLYIFEQRYQQMLQDVEKEDLEFGIYFSHKSNKDQLGSIVRLKKILYQYDRGESDISIECTGLFRLDRFHQKKEGKLYPGGDVLPIEMLEAPLVNDTVGSYYREYMKLRQLEIEGDNRHINAFQVANSLNLSVHEKLKFVTYHDEGRLNVFLFNHLRYQKFIVEQEINYKDNYHLN